MASIQNISNLVEGFVSGEVPAKEFANGFVPIFKSALKSDEYVRAVALAVHAQISHYFHAVITYPVASAPPNPHQAFVLDSEGELIPV
jgi:hypothetical protein